MKKRKRDEATSISVAEFICVNFIASKTMYVLWSETAIVFHVFGDTYIEFIIRLFCKHSGAKLKTEN